MLAHKKELDDIDKTKTPAQPKPAAATAGAGGQTQVAVDAQKAATVASINDLSKNIDDLEKLKKRLDDPGFDIGKIITSVTDKLKAGDIAPALGGVQEIVKKTQELDDALATVSKGTVNLKARMQQFAQSAGLGGKGVYTVKSKEVVMNVNFTVYMDVANVERIMVTRQKSIIRDRLNYAADHVGELKKETGYKIEPNAQNPGLMNDAH
jgi:hypothetical protein